ncbi:receptor-like protein EIX2 [Papaver somniferum]|uniref:receptor-like protein EIX2 n=1 Tax=Papaver somniferum TaxID=3469 RepID=UPI000E6FDDB0|nr:receptor-like protein EIX2 [Papaver somniferum]
MTPFCFLLLLFVPLISITQFPVTCNGCQEHERRALLDFKFSLRDPSNRLDSWQQGSQHENCCDWVGIDCSNDSNPHIVAINLRESSLTGKFSASISNITSLEYLDLAFNNFQQSEIPFQLSRLTKLTHLDLSNSHISATISTHFTNLTFLHHLDLSGNFMVNSPSLKWVRGLVNLEVLNLGGIDLYEAASLEKNFAESISYLYNLVELDLTSCNIFTTVFPTNEFRNLSRLSSLKLSNNRDLNFQIPAQLVNVTSLSVLDLSYCGLQGSVPYLPQLTELDVSANSNLQPDLTRMFQQQWPQLQELSVSFTNVSGPIPSSISNAPSLVTLSASFCSIQGSLPSSIYNLSRLQSLYLYRNNLTGYIHSSISNLKFLNFLGLSHNNLQGSIPVSICNIVSLQELNLDDNNVTGSLPSCLTKLHNLTVLDVSQNSMQGTVSLIDFVNEMNLTNLDMSSNKLTVVIDQNFGMYSKFKLEYLALPSCNLTGSFPTFICEFGKLQHLNLSHNHLTGVIPSCISRLKNFLRFDLSNNEFRGPLPVPPQAFVREITGGIPSRDIPFEISFDVSNNKLSGEISREGGKRLSRFQAINLASNELSGPIPISICSKDSGSLQIIDFSNNKLSGIIPASMGYCMDLVSLNLQNNNLTGNVPNELGNATSLSYLQLNDNNLKGAPLNFISKFQNLEVLNLANNNFVGDIPAAFGSLDFLRIMSLRWNKYNGSIPEEIMRLNRLQILDLSHNHLSGHIPKSFGKYWRGLTKVEFYYPDNIQLQMVVKGIMMQFEKLYNYSSGMDLSGNMFGGSIPTEIGSLKGLATLNLSHNGLSDDIPWSVGNMSSLGSLDLSFNRLSGHIPQSLTSLDFLGVLNVSYNELSGRIPRGDHFDTLSIDGWAFIGNNLLCGEPTKKICHGDQVASTNDTNRTNKSQEDDQENTKERILFYVVIALGFVVGFWGLFLVLLLRKEKWWLSYWRFVDCVADRVMSCIQR